MAIDTNDLILKVSSRISDVVDGDTVLLIEQNIPTSIYRVTKQVATAKPKGHEMLLKEQSVTSANLTDPELAEYTTYKRFDVTTLTRRIVLDGNFHSMTLTSNANTDNVYKVHPVNSLSAMGLSTVHGKACYFIEYPYVYIAYPTSNFTPANTNPVKVTHYAFLPLSEFPAELEDFLVDDLVNLLQGEAQKQQIEKQMPNVN